MNSALTPLFMSACLLGADPCGEPATEIKKAYLYEPAYSIDNVLRGKPVEYKPQPGDLVFFYEDKTFWHIMYKIAVSGPPYHAAIVFQMPDGEYRLLEAGPNDTLRVRLCPMAGRLQSWHDTVYIRRRATPLTDDQSRALTEFALRQDGKRYGIIRLGGQVTPLRSRGPLRTFVIGRPERGHECDNYLCAEIVVEALLYVGLLDERKCRPCCTYPEDMFFDKSRNLFLNRHFRLCPDWHPPQRWTTDPVQP